MLCFTDSEKSNESDSGLSFAKQDINAKIVEPIRILSSNSVLPINKRADAMYKLKKLTEQLAKTKVIYNFIILTSTY